MFLWIQERWLSWQIHTRRLKDTSKCDKITMVEKFTISLEFFQKCLLQLAFLNPNWTVDILWINMAVEWILAHLASMNPSLYLVAYTIVMELWSRCLFFNTDTQQPKLAFQSLFPQILPFACPLIDFRYWTLCLALWIRLPKACRLTSPSKELICSRRKSLKLFNERNLTYGCHMTGRTI